MQDEPSAIELIEAAREFLEKRVMPSLKDHAAFHARVTANALAIVQRELELSPAQNEAEKARLSSLLKEEGTLDELNRALCAKIRDGEMGLKTEGLVEHLWETTLAKVAIDQPKYAAYKQVLSRRRDASKS